jgi:hypothetical protein
MDLLSNFSNHFPSWNSNRIVDSHFSIPAPLGANGMEKDPPLENEKPNTDTDQNK